MRPLLVFTQPRDIPQFVAVEQEQGKEYDRLFIKYTKSVPAYQIARKVFLELTEYTHYIYATDDLLFSNEGLDRLIDDYNKYLDFDKIALAADMNLDTDNPELRGFILYKYPCPTMSMDRQLAFEMYKFATLPEARKYADNNGLVKCSWSSMPLMIIPRHIVERTTFHNDVEYLYGRAIEQQEGCCIDVVFATECARQGFSIMTNLNVQTYHIKPSVKNNEYYSNYMQVGKKKPEWFILRANTNKRIDIL